MKNPSIPSRNVRHSKTLQDAGFILQSPTPFPNSKLVYWRRGEIRLTYFDFQQVSPKHLVGDVIRETIYRARKSAKLHIPELDMGKTNELTTH